MHAFFSSASVCPPPVQGPFPLISRLPADDQRRPLVLLLMSALSLPGLPLAVASLVAPVRAEVLPEASYSTRFLPSVLLPRKSVLISEIARSDFFLLFFFASIASLPSFLPSANTDPPLFLPFLSFSSLPSPRSDFVFFFPSFASVLPFFLPSAHTDFCPSFLSFLPSFLPFCFFFFFFFLRPTSRLLHLPFLPFLPSVLFRISLVLVHSQSACHAS